MAASALGRHNFSIYVLSFACSRVTLSQFLHAEVKATKTVGPVLIHVITDKGRGYDPSLTAADRMHGVTKFDPRTGKQAKGKSTVSWAAFDQAPLHVLV